MELYFLVKIHVRALIFFSFFLPPTVSFLKKNKISLLFAPSFPNYSKFIHTHTKICLHFYFAVAKSITYKKSLYIIIDSYNTFAVYANFFLLKKRLKVVDLLEMNQIIALLLVQNFVMYYRNKKSFKKIYNLCCLFI